jgi:predicted transcriptional regulator
MVTRFAKPSTSIAMRTLRPNGEVTVERKMNFSGVVGMAVQCIVCGR